MPETWDAMMNGYQSLNHCMFGHVMEWFYGYVAGIRQPPGGVGWKQALIAPEPGPLTQAAATLATPAGRILSRWRIQDGTFRLQVEIPADVSASVILPSGAARRFVRFPGNRRARGGQARDSGGKAPRGRAWG